nr:MAG TPA: hypothetical protein [Bacteriophage sp.]
MGLFAVQASPLPCQSAAAWSFSRKRIESIKNAANQRIYNIYNILHLIICRHTVGERIVHVLRQMSIKKVLTSYVAGGMIKTFQAERQHHTQHTPKGEHHGKHSLQKQAQHLFRR